MKEQVGTTQITAGVKVPDVVALLKLENDDDEDKKIYD